MDGWMMDDGWIEQRKERREGERIRVDGWVPILLGHQLITELLSSSQARRVGCPPPPSFHLTPPGAGSGQAFMICGGRQLGLKFQLRHSLLGSPG